MRACALPVSMQALARLWALTPQAEGSVRCANKMAEGAVAFVILHLLRCVREDAGKRCREWMWCQGRCRETVQGVDVVSGKVMDESGKVSGNGCREGEIGGSGRERDRRWGRKAEGVFRALRC